jgi:hypothetical protein
MKYRIAIICTLVFFALTISKAQEKITVNSSLKKMNVVFSLDQNGKVFYQILFEGKEVIKPSHLGFLIDQNKRLDSNFKVIQIDSSQIDESWKPVWGEVNTIKNRCNQLVIHLQQKSAPFYKLNIVFRVFEEGVGFRYEFPLQSSLKFFTVNDELTEFNVTADHKAFWIPADYDSNEYPYTTSKLSEVNAWKFPIISSGTYQTNIPDQYAVQTPLMLKSDDGIYINIHEAALVNYSTMQLHVNRSNYSLSANLVPDALGNKVYLRAPTKTPWRTIIVSDKATEVLASKMILNLNEPSKIVNTSWIKPTKFMGVWWEMQTGKGSWSYTDNIDSLSKDGKLVPHGHHSANTANVKKYIDFASRHGIKGLLVEGWNVGWEEWTGVHKEDNFDFVTPYPDFDVKEIARYSKTKGVQMIMHNETGASAANYDRHMDTAFRFMNQYGYNSVKTGYVGKIIPNGEHHDGQWMVNHYERAAIKAAQYHVMIDMHEPMRPTGLHRTYPNFLACEAGRGNEWNAFSEGNDPDHETIMPFTRLIGGPMDYTPGIFKLRHYAKDAPNRQMHTTLAKQLALYVTMYSPIQMAADLPENYEAHLDAFQFIKDVAVDWDDTKILEAEPGDYITIARKEKATDIWFLGAITDENSRNTTITLNFLDPDKKYKATIYEDGPNADWKNNPEAYQIQNTVVDYKTDLKLAMAKGGGVAIVFRPISKEK